jgi:predicted unusual protein kinase regulating ubiquinone biosynthesis (AarF/ABC1/UbiB family)
MEISKREVVYILMKDHGPKFVGDLDIEDTPIGIASLGQVHKATSKDGKVLAIKVLRDITLDDIDRSFFQLKLLAGVADFMNPGMGGSHTSQIVEEYKEMLYSEIDYEQEAMNAMQMKKYYENIPWVEVPEVHFYSPRTIGYEYIEGIAIDDVDTLKSKFDTTVLAKRVYSMYLKQIFEFGFFHADLHPGNICVESDTGNIVMFDYGMMGEITPLIKDSFQRLAAAVYTNDDALLLYSLQELKIVNPSTRLRNIRGTLDFLLGVAIRNTGANMTNSMLQRKLLKIPKDDFNIPAELVFWFRSIAFVQSAVLRLNPEHDFETPLQSMFPKVGNVESMGKAFMQAGNTAYKVQQSVEQMKESLDSIGEIRGEMTVLKNMVQGGIFIMTGLLLSTLEFL